MAVVMAVMVTSFKRTFANMSQLLGLLYSVSLTAWQATVNPCLHQRLLDIHRKGWLSLLWDDCSFLLRPGVHKVLFVPYTSQIPSYCGSFAILWKFYNQIPLAFKVRFPGGSESLCQKTRLGNLLWALDFCKCENFFG